MSNLTVACHCITWLSCQLTCITALSFDDCDIDKHCGLTMDSAEEEEEDNWRKQVTMEMLQ